MTDAPEVDPLRESLERIAALVPSDGPNAVEVDPEVLLTLVVGEARRALAAPRPDRLSEDERRTVECHRVFVPRDERTFPHDLVAILDAHFPAPVDRPETDREKE